MKILLIGSSGFFGSYFIQTAILKKDILVYAVENKSKIPANHPNLQILQGGLKAVTSKWLDEYKPDVVIHAARPTLPRFRRPGRILASYLAKNLNNTLLRNLIESNHQPPLIFASGTLNYGNSLLPVNETANLNPISYAKDYARGEQPILASLESNQYPIKVLRLPWLLGDGSWFKWFYLQTIHTHGYVPLFGAGENKMSILDVRDAAALFLLHTDSQPFNRVYNLYNSPAIIQRSFAEHMADVFDVPVKPYSGKLEKAAIEAFTSNIEPDTQHPELLSNFEFRTLKQSLSDIKYGAF